MDHQDAEKVACSSHDLIRSVARNLKFYAEVKRREDGFDLTPSNLPQMLFPRLLPRPMLQSALKDISVKHHFSHAQVRCALARIQSSKFPPTTLNMPHREKKIWKIFRRMYNDSSFDHPMSPANDDFRLNLMDLTKESRKRVRVLRDGAKTVRRAPPPSIKHTEENRLVEASWKILLNVESCAEKTPRKMLELGNTKLQNLDRVGTMQRSFMAPIHTPFISTPPLVDKSPRPVQPKYIYDQHGRRHKVVVVE